ncbi:MAG: hypothetical protein NTV94_03020 [Planctomycetota bacterium]|nr:hypothetical protein [Planctomycetota bacterium]
MNRMIPVMVAACTGLAAAGPVDFTGSGANASDIAAVVASFNTAVSLGGGNNGAGGGAFTVGRREINWDAAGLDAFQSPAAMPDNFFNNNSKRGAVFSAPTGRLLVSKRVSDATARFGDIEPSYASSFKTFSPSRVFGVEGGTVVNSSFFVPLAPGQAATVNGFGAIFTDVDRSDSTAIEFYTDMNGQQALLRRILVPVSPDGGLSFAGTFFQDGERVSGVRIIAGNAGLGAGILDTAERDVVAMDDFFYSEPLAVPAPGVAGVAVAAAILGGRRRRHLA